MRFALSMLGFGRLITVQSGACVGLEVLAGHPDIQQKPLCHRVGSTFLW
jgi:hypothetical protein